MLVGLVQYILQSVFQQFSKGGGRASSQRHSWAREGQGARQESDKRRRRRIADLLDENADIADIAVRLILSVERQLAEQQYSE